MKARVIAYVDGFNLFYGIRSASRQSDRRHRQFGGAPEEFIGRSLYWLDVGGLVERRLRRRETCIAVKYFSAPRSVPKLVEIDDAVRASIEASNERQRLYLDAIRATPRLTVHLGWYAEKNPLRCEVCGHMRAAWEEKGTDVNIATEMLRDAYEDRFDLAIVVSADSDLVGPIQALGVIGKPVRVLLPPGRKRAKHIRSIAASVENLKISHARVARLPDCIRRPGLSTLECPHKWMPPRCWVWGGQRDASDDEGDQAS